MTGYSWLAGLREPLDYFFGREVFGRMWRDVPDLIPVEHDPFAVTLTPVEHDPFDPLAASAGIAPQSTPRIDQINWGQPSWLEQADALHKASDPNSLRPTEAAIDFASGMLAPGSTKAAGAAEDIAKGIRAYHASPHDFDRFDMSKIGTGEGAQAYGHGLYFAEHPDTAGYYRKKLASPFNADTGMIREAMGDVPIETEHAQAVRNGAAEQSLSPADAAKRIQWRYPELRDKDQFAGTGGPLHQALTNAVDRVREQGRGRMYEVNIAADPEHFLDWDKPLSEQHPKVQEALDWRTKGPGVQPEEYIQPHHTGEDVYRDMKEFFPTHGEVAERLREAGIPGIKYLDQGSRNVAMMKPEPHEFLNGEKGWRVNGPKGDVTFDTLDEANAYIKQHDKGQTSNYVVFDDKLIDIIKKYGLAGLIAGGAAHFKARATDDPTADTDKAREAFALHHLSQGLRDHVARNRPQL